MIMVGTMYIVNTSLKEITENTIFLCDFSVSSVPPVVKLRALHLDSRQYFT